MNTVNKNLISIPENIDLNLIFDNRSGNSMEIVIPVYNEEKRLPALIELYRPFDLVLLDGGSNDKTIEMALHNGVTVYRRIGESLGENHFTLYANTISKSGRVFYLMADEYVNIADLKNADKILKINNGVARIRKIEWIYCEAPAIERHDRFGMARGFRAGTALWDPHSLHDSLKYSDRIESTVLAPIYDLQHFHIKDVRSEYGKIGRYTDIEVSQMRMRKSGFFAFVRRYFVPFFAQLLWRVWFNKTSISRKLFKLAEMNVSIWLAFMAYLQQNYMPSTDEQLKFYSKFFAERSKV